ncbi:MAG: hypothetical protein K0S71_638 [Clostridia bacterium]|jgi:hypothetical protein|nr:hypothetical protein [Clostridia bacterium]
MQIYYINIDYSIKLMDSRKLAHIVKSGYLLSLTLTLFQQWQQQSTNPIILGGKIGWEVLKFHSDFIKAPTVLVYNNILYPYVPHCILNDPESVNKWCGEVMPTIINYFK